MKVALLSDAGSVHTCRWANALVEKGLKVHLISQSAPLALLDARVEFHQFRNFGIFGYFLIVPLVSRLLSKIKPDIVNAHYASGYGTTARLVNYHPYMLSVWGSDVYDFPYKSKLNAYLLRKNLCAADKIASTSNCMANQILKIAPTISDIAITPFGVDVELYECPTIGEDNETDTIVIGTVKTMTLVYGIDTLLRAFAIVRNKLMIDLPKIGRRLELRLVGGGANNQQFMTLAVDLGIADCTSFVGQVPHSQVPKELSLINIYAALSRQESFGVAAIEAGAACKPAVVSDAEGLSEVIVDGITGFVVPKNDPFAAANAIEILILNAKKRREMGLAGRKHVENNYNWNKCVDNMITTYEIVIGEYEVHHHSIQ